MNREKMRMIGFAALVIILAILVICFDDIREMFNEIMSEQADSLVDQLLR